MKIKNGSSKSININISRKRNKPAISKAAGSGNLTDNERAAKLAKTASMGTIGGGGLNVQMAQQGSFYSPQLSTDFLEKPQTARERREWYRHFYNNDPIVGQAIDIHTELPLSKLILGTPKPINTPKGFDSPHDFAEYVHDFFCRMSENIDLFDTLLTMNHHNNLDGGVYVFVEDSMVEVPMEIGHIAKTVNTAKIDAYGAVTEVPEEQWVAKPDRDDLERAFHRKHYTGWQRMTVLTVDQIVMEKYSFVDDMKIELIPNTKDRELIEKAEAGDPFAVQAVENMPEDLYEYLKSGQNIPLGTDPDEGSFVYYMSNRHGADEDGGHSMLDRCHVPNTSVLVKRNGSIAQVPISGLDPDTDLVLSAKNKWQEFEVTTRKVREPLTEVRIAKIWPPIISTQEHKYPVLRDGVIAEIEAKNIQTGDWMQIAKPTLSCNRHEVDLSDFVETMSLEHTSVHTGLQSMAAFRVLDMTESHMVVQADRLDTNPKRTSKVTNLNSLLKWASTLTEPVKIKPSEICDRFGIKYQTLNEYRLDLAKAGYSVVLGKGGWIWTPNVHGVQVPEPISTNVYGPLKRKLELNSELGYLIGYFLGDGYLSPDPQGYTFNLVHHDPDSRAVASMQHLRACLEKLGGHIGVYAPTMKLTTLRNVVFAEWVSQNFGQVCETKHLPDWILEAPEEFLYGILRGFVDSDGDVTVKDYGTATVRLSNSNEVLIDQLFAVCLALGLPVSKPKPVQPKNVKFPNGLTCENPKMAHSIFFGHGQSVQKFFETGFLSKRPSTFEPKQNNSGNLHMVVGENLYYRVKKVETTPEYEGLVYSLNVHEDHSFFAVWTATQNCLQTLIFRDKLRQAQTQIASRAMTPKRLVWGEDLSAVDVDDLREQIDYALVDPDFTIVTNFEVHWEEIGASGRLLDLTSEWDNTDKLLYAGLGVTESLLSGEALYSGDRLKLEVINTRYILVREAMQKFVEQNLFKPVARRKGFVEKDKWGNERVIYPSLSFTRLPLRDSADTMDAMFNLYNKGSLDVSLMLELLNIDPEGTKMRLERDMFTVNDALFNEGLRGLYGEAGRALIEETNIKDVLTKAMKLQKVAPPEDPNAGGGGRFS